MIALLALSSLMITQDIAPDRITYDQMVDCAATFRVAAAVADMDGERDLVEPALAGAVGYVHLAYLYGEPLGETREATDAAVEAEVSDQIARYGPALDGPAPQLARQVMSTDQQVCQTVLMRLVRETGEE